MKTNFSEILAKQKAYFLDGNTMDVTLRKMHLKRLMDVLKSNEEVIADAIYRDFRKSFFEVRINELGLAYMEIRRSLKNLNKWSKPKKRFTTVINIPGRSRIYSIPYGNVLIIGPWNFPVQLILIPLISALAAGNTAIIKPSELTVHTSHVMARILNEAFPPELLYVAEGGVEETTELLKHRFDKVFFTGSTQVGKIVMKAAAEHLTPVTLELGGKNPAIVLADCHLQRTVQRLVWGKFYNGAQACVVPNHVYVEERIKDAFLAELKKRMNHYFGKDPANCEALPRIINEAHVNRLIGFIDKKKVFAGGDFNAAERYIEPTVLTDVDEDDPVMKDEIFGPILPILTFTNLDELLSRLKMQASPLALYIFTNRKKRAKQIQKNFRSGSGMINDTVLQFINFSTPFGGIGDSGMGSYHGKAGFDCFSHRKSVLIKPWWFELWIKYPPFTKQKLGIIKRILK